MIGFKTARGGCAMKETFGQALREARRSRNVSQRELAREVGVDFSYISKIENDRLPPPAADTIVRICEVLEVPAEELLALKGKMPSDFEDTIGSSPAALKFVNQAQTMDLTEDEWEKLARHLRRLRG
jgi:transcriptional regulator with XRE-family HTH domain